MNFNSPPGGYASQLAWSVTGIQELNRRVTAILENGGGGILPTLQQVTDAGNTTTATINATEFATFSDDGTIGISITTKPNGGRSNIIFVQESGTAAIKCNPLTDDVTQTIQNKSGTIALLENLIYSDVTTNAVENVVTIAHGLPTSPVAVIVQPKNYKAGNYLSCNGNGYYISWDITNVIITSNSTPPEDTDLEFHLIYISI